MVVGPTRKAQVVVVAAGPDSEGGCGSGGAVCAVGGDGDGKEVITI